MTAASLKSPTALSSEGPQTEEQSASVSAVGAVIVGGDYQGLGIVRSLGRRGIPVCVIDDERSISSFSRHTTHSVTLPDLRQEDAVVDAVLKVGARLNLKGWVLFPTRDETVAAFARNRGRLAEFYRLPTPDWNTIKWIWDKRNTYQLANELGIPTPHTMYVRTLDELEAIHTDFPVAIKPAIKEHFFYATKAKAWRANNPTELRDLFKKMPVQMEPGEVMVQDLIPGDGRHQFAYCAFFKEGKALGSMVVQRRRQHPPEFGRASTFVETTEVPLIEELSERFLRAIDYYGLVELEYKLDPRDGQCKLLDVNGRTWGYHTLGAKAGVDFSHMLFADQLGQPVQPCRGRAGVSWLRLVTDLPTGALGILRGQQHWRTYLRSLTSADVEAVFSWEDPLPGMMEIALIPYLAARRGF